MNSSERTAAQHEQPQPAVFPERHSYRYQRLLDATKFLPVLGVLLFLLPLLWPESDLEGAGVAMSSAIIYLFSVWIALILAILIFVKGLRAWSRTRDGQEIG